MNYDVVIASLNRADSLKACLSLVEQQTQKPKRVVVVDASDNHEDVRAQVMKDRDRTIDWCFLKSQKKSLPYQRNLGLQFVEHEVVLMPDDDSMLYPGAAAEMLAAYRLDQEGQVAGVSASPASRPPQRRAPTQIRRSRVLKDRIDPTRAMLEDVLVPPPFRTYPRSIWRTRVMPDWIDDERFGPVETIGGYLLSLRAEVAKQELFDETLAYGIGYALHEDMELSIRLQNHGHLLVAARRAPIFHDVHPSRRARGYEYGFCWIANYVYACRKNMPESSASWGKDLPRFLRYKIALYRARAAVRRDQHSRDVLAGAQDAWTSRDDLMSVGPGELVDAYKRLCDKFIRR